MKPMGLNLSKRLAGRVRALGTAALVAAAFVSEAASCKPAPDASVIKGLMGKVALSIPTDVIASGVVFVGQNVWTSNDAQPLPFDHSIRSFDIALDRKSLQLVHFDAADPHARLDHDKYIFADIETEGVPSSDAGIAARHILFVETMMHRAVRNEVAEESGLRVVTLVGPKSRENGGFNSNYFSASPVVNITCGRAVQIAAPFRDVSTCFEDFAFPAFGAGVRVFIEKSDLPRWKAIRNAFASSLHGFAPTAHGDR